MYDNDTKNQFIELRAKGWSLGRTSEQLKVSQRTLVDWNRQEREQIRTLRARRVRKLYWRPWVDGKRTCESLGSENLKLAKEASPGKSSLAMKPV
jgi:hypothetical protein